MCPRFLYKSKMRLCLALFWSQVKPDETIIR